MYITCCSAVVVLIVRNSSGVVLIIVMILSILVVEWVDLSIIINDNDIMNISSRVSRVAYYMFIYMYIRMHGV